MATVAKSNALIHALAGGSNGHRSPRDMFGRNKQRKKSSNFRLSRSFRERLYFRDCSLSYDQDIPNP